MTHPDRPHVPATDPEQTPQRGPRWIIALMVLVVLVGAVGGGFVGWTYWRSGGVTENYVTPRGAFRTLELPDGSRLTMDAATQLQTRFSGAGRDVILEEGRVDVTVVADPEREFHVIAGDVRTRVPAGRVLVRSTGFGLDGGSVRVEVLDGSAQVRPSGAGRMDLAAGQSVVAAAGRGGQVQALDAGRATAWRDGVVHFVDTPLVYAIGEFERYASTGVMVPDPSVAMLRVNGDYRVDDVQGFLDSLMAQLPVRFERREQGLVVVRTDR